MDGWMVIVLWVELDAIDWHVFVSFSCRHCHLLLL